MTRALDRSGEASRTDWFSTNDQPDLDDPDYQQEHAVQDELFEAGSYDERDPLLDLVCGHRAEETERHRYGPDAWCAHPDCRCWRERIGWPEP